MERDKFALRICCPKSKHSCAHPVVPTDHIGEANEMMPTEAREWKAYDVVGEVTCRYSHVTKEYEGKFGPTLEVIFHQLKPEVQALLRSSGDKEDRWDALKNLLDFIREEDRLSNLDWLKGMVSEYEKLIRQATEDRDPDAEAEAILSMKRLYELLKALSISESSKQTVERCEVCGGSGQEETEDERGLIKTRCPACNGIGSSNEGEREK